MFRTLVLFAALGLSIASAKSYEIQLDNPTKVAGMDLKPGKYSVAVMDDTKIKITDASGKSLEASAKISTADKKFNATMVDIMQGNGSVQIREIDLGGTKTKILFE